MTSKTKYTIGLAISILGFALLLLNAVDYLLKWNQTSSAISANGIMLAVIGAGLIRRTKIEQKKENPSPKASFASGEVNLYRL